MVIAFVGYLKGEFRNHSVGLSFPTYGVADWTIKNQNRPSSKNDVDALEKESIKRRGEMKMKSAWLAVVIMSLGLGVSSVSAQSVGTSSYLLDQRGDVVKSGSGLCWRTSSWTPAAAAQDKFGCACDADMLPASVCTKSSVIENIKPDSVEKKPEIVSSKISLSGDLLFDFNKSTLRKEGSAKLDEIVKKVKGISLEVIIVIGHTDRIGSESYNKKLSAKRASAVKDYLVAKGVPAARVYTEGQGSKKPVTNPSQCAGGKSAKTIACLQPDRRVDIEVIGTTK